MACYCSYSWALEIWFHNLGFAIGIVLASLMALVTFGDITHLVIVWCVFAVTQFLEGTFITPRVLGNTVGLSPLVIILAIASQEVA